MKQTCARSLAPHMAQHDGSSLGVISEQRESEVSPKHMDVLHQQQKK